MRKHFPHLLLVGALLSPATLYALGLGEIRLNSALNQPFDADIELIAPTSEELSSLKIGLAGNDMFSRYGLDRPAFLSNFDFAVNRSGDGRVSVKVTSNRSVTEPFVTILVEASWSRGRVLREYTVLLDPPVFMPADSAAPAAVTAPEAGARPEGRIERAPPPQPATPLTPPEQPVAAEQAPASPQAPSEVEPEAQAGAAAGGSYTVQRNDTLWRIASDIRPGSPRVVNQTMIALFRANPEAFDGNINRLLAGAILRVPELVEIQQLSASEASAEVARQTQAWRGDIATADAQETGRLRLVTPGETPPAPTASATPAEPVAPETTAPQAAASPGDDERLAVESPDLQGLQQQVDESPAEPVAVPDAAGEEATAAEPTAQVEEPVAAEPPPESVQPAPAPPVAAPEPGPSLMERIGQFWWMFVVGGLVVLAGLVAAFLKRRREEAELSESLETLAAPTFEPRPSRPAPAPASARARSDDFSARSDDFSIEPPAEPAFDAFDEPLSAAPAARAESADVQPHAALAEPSLPEEPPVKVTEDTLSSETAVRFDQQDALAEADFHMAYGLYDQAADLVKIAIEREPERRELKLKLLEIYFVWGNRDLFLDTARELHAGRDQAAPGEWDKVLIMGKQIAPEDPMFKGPGSLSGASAHADLVDVNLEGGENRVDIDLFSEPAGEKSADLDLEFGTGEHKAVKGEDSDLDFLLDEPQRGAEEEPTRELDPLARTQETPTVESPMIERTVDRTSQTVREKVDTSAFTKPAAGEQTAELSLDDLGLDVDSFEATGSLEETSSLKEAGEADGASEPQPPLRDDELTQLAPSMGSADRTLESPRPKQLDPGQVDPGQVDPGQGEPGQFDSESTGTIYIDQVDLSAGDTVEQVRPDIDSTASMHGPSNGGRPARPDSEESAHTVRRAVNNDSLDDFSEEIFGDSNGKLAKLDLDVGDPLGGEDYEPTRTQSNTQALTAEMELSELEPVTMSEVGTKLDLARAYMDMGDPDGARSILDEVLSEGNPNQKQEAQRLMESIR